MITYGGAILALVSVLMYPACVQGQLSSPQPTQAECEQFRADVAAGDRSQPRVSALAWCGPLGAQMLADLVRGVEREADESYMEILWRAASSVQDPNILDAAREVALDRGAATPPRIMAMMILLGQYDIRFNLTYYPSSWTEFLNTPFSKCSGGIAEHGDYIAKHSMPADFQQQIGNVFSTLRLDETEDFAIKTLAECLDMIT